MSNEVVPFGKYKGQPVEILRADDDYCQWLMGQDWFRIKFGNIYQTIINYGGEPQESPEHNELQASFLDDARCFRLARLLYPNHPFDREAANRGSGKAVALCREFKDNLEPQYEDANIAHRKFEDQGWDVVYSIWPAVLVLAIASLPGCSCGECDHDTDCPKQATCRGGDGWEGPDRLWRVTCKHYEHQKDRLLPSPEWLTKPPKYWSYTQSGDHCSKKCPWGAIAKAEWLLGDNEEKRWFQPRMPGRIRVECKPDLGDDFPAVLRQVTSYKYEHGDRRCVVARRARFEKVTWVQVVTMFAASGIVLLREAQLSTEAIPSPDRSKEG